VSHVTLGALLARVTARFGRGPQFGLDGVRRALGMVGDPQRELACVHVAGTNGKGSVCAMVEAVARAAGLRTGMYTSPHLSRFAERIQLGGQPIDDDRLAHALEVALDPRLPPLTFFETLTVAGFHAMRQAAVELAVVEVGLGGRLDATNVIEQPLATAIVSIGLDHVEYLGHDLASIGREKAGIIKRGCPLVLGPLAPEAERAILQEADRVGPSVVWRAGPAVQAGDGTVELTGPEGRRVHVHLGLGGSYQRDNAAVAAAVLWQLEQRWPELGPALGRGLGQARWPGRFERLEHQGRSVILDCAHNPAGAEALAHALGGALDPARTTLVFGAMSDKLWRPSLTRLAPLASRRVYAEPLQPLGTRHSAAPAELAAVAPGECVADPVGAFHRALEASAPGDTLLITGSIFLVGAVRAEVLGLANDQTIPA
jgi:dihydrofolate synthase / folylpolyglutamate synthase